MSDRQAKFEGTKDVLSSHKFDLERLNEFLLSSIEGFKGPLEVKQFKGGQSNPTYLLVTPNKKYV